MFLIQRFINARYDLLLSHLRVFSVTDEQLHFSAGPYPQFPSIETTQTVEQFVAMTTLKSSFSRSLRDGEFLFDFLRERVQFERLSRDGNVFCKNTRIKTCVKYRNIFCHHPFLYIIIKYSEF